MNAAPERLIACEGLSLFLGGRVVIDDVAMAVNRGEVVTLIGPNGAGKSTLVKILLGLIRPDAGRVERAEGLRVGYLPQRFSVDAVMPLTVSRLLSLTRRVDANAQRAALEEVGAAHLAAADVHSLSGGEMQRVLLARALIGRPDLLVLDEPTQGVDYTGEAELYDLVRDLQRRLDCGVLMISHDLHVVMAATDRVLCLNRHMCCSGSPQAVSSHPEVKALFGERGALALYTHHHDHSHDLDGSARHGRKDGGNA